MTALPRKASPRSRGALETNAQWVCGGSSTVVGQGRASQLTLRGFSISCIIIVQSKGRVFLFWPILLRSHAGFSFVITIVRALQEALLRPQAGTTRRISRLAHTAIVSCMLQRTTYDTAVKHVTNYRSRSRGLLSPTSAPIAWRPRFGTRRHFLPPVRSSRAR